MQGQREGNNPQPTEEGPALHGQGACRLRSGIGPALQGSGEPPPPTVGAGVLGGRCRGPNLGKRGRAVPTRTWTPDVHREAGLAGPGGLRKPHTGSAGTADPGGSRADLRGTGRADPRRTPPPGTGAGGGQRGRGPAPRSPARAADGAGRERPGRRAARRGRPRPARADTRARPAGPRQARPHSPSSSSFSSRRASRLSRRSCFSISALIRLDSFTSSLRQHAIMDSRVIVPAPAARRPPPPPPPPGPGLARSRPGRARLALGVRPPGRPVHLGRLRAPVPAWPRTPAPPPCARARAAAAKPQPPRPSDSAAQPNPRPDSADGRAARPMGGAGGPRARGGGGTSGGAGRGDARARRGAARRARPRVRLRRRGKGDAQPGAGRGRPGLWECGGLGGPARRRSAPLGPARVPRPRTERCGPRRGSSGTGGPRASLPREALGHQPSRSPGRRPGMARPEMNLPLVR